MTASNRTLPAILLGTTSDAWCDERERSVMLEAYAYVFILGTGMLGLVLAVVAWFIPAWVTIALFLVFVLPSWEWQRYCKARGVDANTLAYGGESVVRIAISSLIAAGCAVSMVAAVTVQIAPDDSTLSGGIVGGIAGGLAAIVFARWSAKRKKRQALLDED